MNAMRAGAALIRAEVGAGIGAGLLLCAAPAFADQHVMAADNGQVGCEASARDLTRIALKDDQFASVSKVSSGVPTEDFSVVNEPVRGDIYISVPEGYARKTVSFFGTTRKGFVYKFVCTIAGDDAKQVFVANADLEKGPAAAAEAIPAGLSGSEGAVRLVRAMYQQLPVDGFEIRQRGAVPVNVGALRVQMVAEYRGATLTGKAIKVENRGPKPVEITEEMVAPGGGPPALNPVAVSIAAPRLAPGQATTAYIVMPTGDAR